MKDAPERIKAWNWNDRRDSGMWHISPRGETTEYVRADLADHHARLAAHAKALAGALREVDGMFDRYCDRVGAADGWARILRDNTRAAIAAYEKDAKDG